MPAKAVANESEPRLSGSNADRAKIQVGNGALIAAQGRLKPGNLNGLRRNPAKSCDWHKMPRETCLVARELENGL